MVSLESSTIIDEPIDMLGWICIVRNQLLDSAATLLIPFCMRGCIAESGINGFCPRMPLMSHPTFSLPFRLSEDPFCLDLAIGILQSFTLRAMSQNRVDRLWCAVNAHKCGTKLCQEPSLAKLCHKPSWRIENINLCP